MFYQYSSWLLSILITRTTKIYQKYDYPTTKWKTRATKVGWIFIIHEVDKVFPQWPLSYSTDFYQSQLKKDTWSTLRTLANSKYADYSNYLGFSLPHTPIKRCTTYNRYENTSHKNNVSTTLPHCQHLKNKEEGELQEVEAVCFVSYAFRIGESDIIHTNREIIEFTEKKVRD